MKQYSVKEIQVNLPFDEEFEVTRYNIVIGHYIPVKSKPTPPTNVQQGSMKPQKKSPVQSSPALCIHGALFGLCKYNCKPGDKGNKK